MQIDERRSHIRSILLSDPKITQEELGSRLRAEGIEVTQSTLSRDLAEMGAIKRKGIYALPDTQTKPFVQAGLRAMASAGPHLVVVHTEVGCAQRVGLMIDHEAIPGVVGTLAGDDTIFIALSQPDLHAVVQKRLGL